MQVCGNAVAAQQLRQWLRQWHERINKGDADAAPPKPAALKAPGGFRQHGRAVLSSSDSDDDWFQVGFQGLDFIWPSQRSWQGASGVVSSLALYDSLA